MSLWCIDIIIRLQSLLNINDLKEYQLIYWLEINVFIKINNKCFQVINLDYLIFVRLVIKIYRIQFKQYYDKRSRIIWYIICK